MGQPRRAKSSAGKIEEWERELIKATARRFDTTDPDELQAELALHLFRLKQRPRQGVKNWVAFLTTALGHKASNWIRNQQARRKRLISLDQPSGAYDEAGSLADMLTSPASDQDRQIALALAWNEFNPKLKLLWRVLSEEEGKLGQIAKRLGIHRNTVRGWIGKIRLILINHGLEPGILAIRKAVTPESATRRASRMKRYPYVVIPERLLRALGRSRFSGTQWRILLWVIRQIGRRKQKTVAISWSGIAKALSLNRGSTYRAAKGLLRTRLLFEKKGRFGLRKNFRCSR